MVLDSTLPIIVIISVALILLGGYRRTRLQNGLRYPPGPGRRLPILGNILDFPLERAWLTFERWRTEHGELAFAQMLGKSVLILNSSEAVNTLLDKRFACYSDRPTMTMVGELMGLDNSVPLLQYGRLWRRHRKMAHIALNSEAIKEYHHVQEDAAAILIYGLLQDPRNFDQQIRLAAGRIIMSVTYGIPVNTPDDVYISDAERTMTMIGKAMLPGAFLVDIVPVLAKIPRWIPFLTFHLVAERGRSQIEDMVSRPFNHVKRQIEEGIAATSFTSSMLESCNKEGDDEHVIKWVSGAMYGAGGESTYATVLSFIWAMCTYPTAQSKAQLELDSVIPPGEHRLPNLGDRECLPYVNALIKETMRWRPALPLGIARRTSRPDVYKGFFIPSATIVIPNIWALSRDERSGIPSESFEPDRFLGAKPPPDPSSYAFGFGRRICPGKALAENSLFLIIAGLLYALRIEHKSDNTAIYTNGIVSWPTGFEPIITARSPDITRTVFEQAQACV